MKYFIIAVLLCSPLFSLSSEKKIVSLRCRNAGMFSLFDDALSLLKGYENHKFTGVEIDFGTEGLYYDIKHGRNWWNYYCEPVKYGRKNGKKKYVQGALNHIVDPNDIEEHTSREEANYLINKYISIKPNILEKVDQFSCENFTKKFLLCVHYRGTDKISEAPRVPYSQVSSIVDQLVPENNFKIFVATDEEHFLTYMIQQYGDRICYNSNVLRSRNNKPTYRVDKNHYQSGLEAMVDALLLSKGDILIRTSSNLSRWSSYFNPDCQVIELSERY